MRNFVDELKNRQIYDLDNKDIHSMNLSARCRYTCVGCQLTPRKNRQVTLNMIIVCYN